MFHLWNFKLWIDFIYIHSNVDVNHVIDTLTSFYLLIYIYIYIISLFSQVIHVVEDVEISVEVQYFNFNFGCSTWSYIFLWVQLQSIWGRMQQNLEQNWDCLIIDFYSLAASCSPSMWLQINCSCSVEPISKFYIGGDSKSSGSVKNLPIKMFPLLIINVFLFSLNIS